jgi:hypothetical protein
MMLRVNMGPDGSRKTEASRRRSSKRKPSIHRGHDGDQDGDPQPKRQEIDPKVPDAEMKSMLLKLRESTQGFMASHRDRDDK